MIIIYLFFQGAWYFLLFALAYGVISWVLA